MALESHYSGTLAKALRNALQGAVVIRHSDTFVAGIPDMSVTWAGQTYWLEVKVRRPGRSISSRDVQGESMHRLFLASGGRAIWVVYDEKFGVTRAQWGDTMDLLGPSPFAASWEGKPHAKLVAWLRGMILERDNP